MIPSPKGQIIHKDDPLVHEKEYRNMSMNTKRCNSSWVALAVSTLAGMYISAVLLENMVIHNAFLLGFLFGFLPVRLLFFISARLLKKMNCNQ